MFQAPPAWSAGSYWAPEIAQEDGRFYIYYTARKKDGPLCVSVADSERPDGPYTDHGPLVCQEVGSIDPAPTRDENGRRYLVWKEDGNSRKQPTLLWAQPLSDDGLKLVGDKQPILRNEAPWEAHLVEGPFRHSAAPPPASAIKPAPERLDWRKTFALSALVFCALMALGLVLVSAG